MYACPAPSAWTRWLSKLVFLYDIGRIARNENPPMLRTTIATIDSMMLNPR
jgi:hypothetical protein